MYFVLDSRLMVASVAVQGMYSRQNTMRHSALRLPKPIELPEYKLPDSRTVAIYVWEKVKDYLGKAGTTIFVATLIIWVLLNFGVHGYATDMSESFILP